MKVIDVLETDEFAKFDQQGDITVRLYRNQALYSNNFALALERLVIKYCPQLHAVGRWGNAAERSAEDIRHWASDWIDMVKNTIPPIDLAKLEEKYQRMRKAKLAYEKYHGVATNA